MSGSIFILLTPGVYTVFIIYSYTTLLQCEEVDLMSSGGYGGGYGSNFALIVVLFILLIIVGVAYVGGGFGGAY